MKWKEKVTQILKKPQWTFFLIVFLLIVGVLTIRFSYALFSTRVEKSGTLNIVAGDFTYGLASNELTNNRITVNPNTEKMFEITITNTNDRDTSYELYYKLVSPSNLPNNVEIGYANTTKDTVKGRIVEKGKTKIIQVLIRNKSSDILTLEFGVQGGLLGKNLILEKGTSLNHEIEIVSDPSGAPVPELEENMIPVKYDDKTKTWVKADSSNPLDNSWFSYHKRQWANAVTVDQNKVIDISGNDHSGMIYGATVTSGEATFDGVDDYIDCGLANYDFGMFFTTIVRFKMNEISNRVNYIIGNVENAGMYLYFKNQTISYAIHDGTKYQHFDSPVSIELGQWYEVAVVFDGKYIMFYQDGKKVATNVLIQESNMKVSKMPFYLGANPDAGKPMELGKVSITKAQVYDRSLSEAEIKENYGKDVPQDKSKLLFAYDFKKGNDIEVGSPISMDAINTMMVWIPRYKYVMPKEKEGQVDIVFENKNTAKSVGTATGTSYLTHPAFTFGTTELNGIWVGKFESSSDFTCTTSTGAQGTGCDLPTINPQIKPNAKSWTGARVSTFFTASRNMQAAGNPYGYRQSEIDTHMMKNSEWGAVAYLTQSKYGRCTDGTCTEVTINNLNSGDGRTITGCAADTIIAAELKQVNCPDTNRYNTEKGVLASTTGNVYGIYDMAGGNWEYVMGNYNKYSGYTAISYTAEQAATILGTTNNAAVGIWNSGFNGPVFGKALDGSVLSWTTGIDFPEEKYYNLYTTNSPTTSCNGKVCLGHALSETAGWYRDYQYHVTSSTVWFIRGGGYGNEIGAGILSFSNSYGYGGISISSRLVVSKK